MLNYILLYDSEERSKNIRSSFIRAGAKKHITFCSFSK